MRKSIVRLAVILAVGAIAVGFWASRRNARSAIAAAAGAKSPPPSPVAAVAPPAFPATRPAPAVDPAAAGAARVKAILRDYEEISAKMSADYGAAGQKFPGGVSAFLRQLALVDREKRKDLATVMTPRELEDYEIGETAAGQKMRAILDGTAATDEQRRAAFRAEQDFNDKFGFTFDLSPAALAVREAGRQAAQQQIHEVLGDVLFTAWVQRDDPAFRHAVEFAQQQNLPADAALALLSLRNGFTLSAIDIASGPPEQARQRRAALVEWARAGLAAKFPSLPPGVVEREVAGWLESPSR